jgi:hypothetical protein
MGEIIGMTESIPKSEFDKLGVSYGEFAKACGTHASRVWDYFNKPNQRHYKETEDKIRKGFTFFLGEDVENKEE